MFYNRFFKEKREEERGIYIIYITRESAKEKNGISFRFIRNMK